MERKLRLLRNLWYPLYLYFLIYTWLTESISSLIKYFRQYYQKDVDPSLKLSESALQSIVRYHYYHDALQYLNIAFLVLFTLECILKMMALNPKVKIYTRPSIYLINHFFRIISWIFGTSSISLR